MGKMPRLSNIGIKFTKIYQSSLVFFGLDGLSCHRFIRLGIVDVCCLSKMIPILMILIF
ncbi:hypothetical protein AO372_1061 [Moraxella catarrhalis]|uniref:Uncharacterized protein n=2 Tax=Moraxella catarrhalis TaxID=480 RepID=A0AB36DP87_MORCA|nr:hypothetical protein AO372_1061 [Moraxella catarrhalis]OAV25576.1 hypothetical protein AO370_1046 [Moraxella catarrhalis]